MASGEGSQDNEVIICAFKSHVYGPKRLEFKTLSPELSFHICVHPYLKAFALHVACAYRRVVAHLLREEAPLVSLQFESLTKHRIERLSSSLLRATVLADR